MVKAAWSIPDSPFGCLARAKFFDTFMFVLPEELVGVDILLLASMGAPFV